MLVNDVMTKSVVTATPDEDVSSVVMRMVTRHCGTIPIVDASEGLLLGVVALRDVLMPLYPTYAELLEDGLRGRDFISMESGYGAVMDKKISEIMTPNPLSVLPSDPILKAASIMGNKNLRRIPVTTTEGVLVGMVSIGDVNRALFFAYGSNKSSNSEFPKLVANE